MTLHWWMHWFWVTAHFSVILCVPMPSTTNEPLTDINSNMAQRVMFVRITTPVPENSRKNTEEPFRSSLRIAKAISSFEPSIKINTVSLAGPELPKQSQITSRIEKYRPETNQWYQAPTISSELFLPTSDINKKSKLNHFNIQRDNENIEIKNDNYEKNDEIFERRKNTRITWILTTSRPKRRRTNENENISLVEKLRNFTDNNGRDLTVLPLRVEETRFKVIVNTSQTINNDRDGISISSRTLNRSENIEIDREFSDPRFSAQTASPVLQASIGELTRERLNRARLSSSDFQSVIAEDRSSQDSLDRMDDMDDVVDGQSGLIGGFTTQNSTMTVFNIAAITGSCLALIVLVSTIGSLGFLMYRRKYLNPPQTLNSDKCSNPDSSGYIDDTTIRDNSEEMYSLDNDSFLNSLEAMTIQNYWTDSVKHTKL